MFGAPAIHISFIVIPSSTFEPSIQASKLALSPFRRTSGAGSPFPGMVVALAVCVPCFCGAAQAQDCAPPRLENAVKMEPLGDHGRVAIPVVMNGVEKKFLFDTGGGAENYVSSAVARELKLKLFNSAKTVDLKGNVSSRAAIVDNVSIGEFNAARVVFQVAPRLAYDGILSAGAMAALHLAAVDLDMDFADMKLNLFSADHCQGDVVYWPHQVLAVVPVTSEMDHIEITAAVDGHELMAVIDTGAPWTIVNLDWAKHNLGFSPDPSLRISNTGSDDQTYIRRYFVLWLPGVTVTNPLVIVRPLEFRGEDVFGADMVIGMEVLRQLHIYYAVQEQKLYITPASGPDLLPEAASVLSVRQSLKDPPAQ
jgi:predicted aspartyl protease